MMIGFREVFIVNVDSMPFPLEEKEREVSLHQGKRIPFPFLLRGI
jgi:hypothetical protein